MKSATEVGFIASSTETARWLYGITGKPGTDHGQCIYQLGCSECGHVYGANGADIFERKCPRHQNGAPGLAL
jgi:hypothetical protein